MRLLQLFQQFIQKENLFSPKDTLLLAVSGGIDSVVLCELCQQAGYNFVIAHCNFQLRAQESERDEQFVRALGEKYGKQVLVKRFETEQYAAAKKVSIQVAARELRYAWFDREASGVNRERFIQDPESLAEIKDSHVLITDVSRQVPGVEPAHALRLPSHVLTAHHADDNTETMLMNFFKGTGIAGLRGILPKQGKIIRPLLFAKKEDIKKFATENNLHWVEDSSNQSDKYARNYFRNQLIPLVKNLYPEAENNLASNLQRFKDIELLYQQSVNLHKKKLLEYKANEVHIPVLKLQKAVPLHSIVYEIIKDYQFSAHQVEEVISLLDSETGRYVQSGTHIIFKNRHWLIISPNQTKESSNILIEEPCRVNFENGFITLRIQPNAQFPPETSGPNSNAIALLDASLVTFSLLLRKWKAGDYFYPLGMKKKKKLSRFFIDQKLSKTAKEKVWVIEMDKKIIWVVGHRIDDRFKITPSTKQVLQILSEAVNV